MPFARFFKPALLSVILCFASISALHAADWPKGYVIAKGSTSPDGRYGVLIPGVDEGNDDAYEKNTNTLVNLSTHRSLGTIAGAHYSASQNHHGLTVTWAADSSWSVVTYEARFGFDTITAVEPRGTTCAQTDLDTHIQKALDAVVARQVRKGEDTEACGSAHFCAGPERKILIRAVASTNPKGLQGRPTYCSLFQGTFDLATGKWVRSEARKIANGQDDELEAAFSNDLEQDFNDEKDRLQWYDDRLNEVYSAVRILLPAERFAAVKKEQIAWLKQLETKDTIAKKCDFMAARIKELRALVW